MVSQPRTVLPTLLRIVSSVTRLTIVLGINAFLSAALVDVGLTGHSLAVLAEGGDYLADAAAIGVRDHRNSR